MSIWATPPRIEVEGLRETQKAFRDLEKDARRELTATMRRVAEPMAATARAMAPSAGRHGLRRSIKVRATQTGAAVGSPKVHAPIIEFGKKAVVRGPKQAPHVRKLTPQPWLIPAVESGLPVAERAVVHELRALLRKHLPGSELI